MMTLLGSLIGFLSSLFPEFFKIYRDKRDREHELILLDKQIALQEKGASERLSAIGVSADTEEFKALMSTYKVGIEWVDALNGTVRPVLAYAFFLLYAAVKLGQFLLLEGSGAAALSMMWGEEDQAIFAAVISFYFGSRALSKARK